MPGVMEMPCGLLGCAYPLNKSLKLEMLVFYNLYRTYRLKNKNVQLKPLVYIFFVLRFQFKKIV